MKKLRLIILALIITVLTSCTNLSSAFSGSVAVQSAGDAMRATTFVQRSDGGSGSGFHIGAGYFVTNWHVVSKGNSPDEFVPIRLNNKFAQVVAQDMARDLAIIYCVELDKLPHFVPAKWDPNLTDHVYSIGSHWGMAETISSGRISAFEENNIITTCPMNPGCSGGPLVNRKFQVIGVNVAGLFAYRQYAGISIHIKFKVLHEYIQELREMHGK